ncbi:MAG: alpha/beta hydrolase [Clostridia bacterium]|nr:alpha/beta hydrolase [Clostridia bacterium]
MSKYPIKKEFFPFTLLTPPIRDPESAGKMGEMMKPPGWLWRDKEISTRCETIEGYRGEPIEVFVMEPRNIETDNCLIYYHGGGFFFEGAGYHYKNAKTYALHVPCKVLFVQYRLAPKHPFPVPAEDSYGALLWAYENAEKLGISRDKIAVGGDSAGGCLTAAVTQMARDRRAGINIRFQLLLYPFVDQSMDTDSNRRFTDTPMWNSTLSLKMAGGYVQSRDVENFVYASPMEGDCADLPPAYIETAEFDCLHDDGIHYADKLRDAGIAVELNETEGTMHGFDIVQKAPTTKAAVAARIDYMRRGFTGILEMF